MAFAALTIDINAKLANLEQGLGRAESQLAGFAQKAQSAAAGIAAGFGAIAGGLAVGVVLDRFAAAVTELADLDDAAESTGASVEELSSILNTVAPTGVGLEQITDYAVKLAKAMREAEEPTSAQAQAFKALGIATKDTDGNLRSTGAVLDDVARQLALYTDGTNKTALAQVLLGRSGAEALPFLKDLATRTRESATVSAEAAAEAERLANAWRAIKRDGELAVQSIAAQIIPTLANLAERFRETGKAGGTMWDQIRGVLGPNKAIADLEKDLAGLTEQRSVAERLGFSKESLADFDARIARVRKSIDALRPAQRQVNGPSPRELIFGNAGYGDTDKPQAPNVPDAPSRPKAAATERQSEAERLLATLQAQLDTTRSLTVEQQVLAKIGRGEVGGLNPALEQQILLQATLIDKEKERRAASDAAAKAALDRIAAYDRAEQDAQAGVARDTEAIRDLVDPVRALYRELERVRELAAGGVLPQDVANARQAQILSQIDGVLAPVPDKVAEANDAARELGLTFQSAFEDAIVGGEKFSKVLQSLGRDILRIVVRKSITEPLVGALLGGNGKDGLLSGFLGSIFGGARAAGGPVSAGRAYLVGERGPELVVPRAAGTVMPAGSFGGGTTVVHNHYHIDSRTDRSVIVADIQRAQTAARGAQRDARLRGNEAFA